MAWTKGELITAKKLNDENRNKCFEFGKKWVDNNGVEYYPNQVGTYSRRATNQVEIYIGTGAFEGGDIWVDYKAPHASDWTEVFHEGFGWGARATRIVSEGVGLYRVRRRFKGTIHIKIYYAKTDNHAGDYLKGFWAWGGQARSFVGKPITAELLNKGYIYTDKII